MPHSLSRPTPVTRLRRLPVQERSNERVEGLLRAAASVVDRVGSIELTPALVAEEAHTSVGTVYRYFPDAKAVIVALGERNFQLLRRLIAIALAQPHTDGQSVFHALVRSLLTAYRTIPSFRAIRTAGWLLVDIPARAAPADLTILDDVVAALERQDTVPLTPHARAALGRAFVVVDALVLAAFQRDAAGDPETLHLAVRLGMREAAAAFAQAEGSEGADAAPLAAD
ncbi:AcrR family transcriptional regulator [Microbacterium sp. SORGH_AS428]|uniref:TetR/AcrR family transcriptional regulator n=1 Tax=Microbacterium sp. SORGH_AS_0428 TaxID=3041788 RepID=UPI002860F7C8|nr:TetR/AcrR family transcriptional regulator [Microbacterium sp. SORGH_AS_0428]MDR6199740.1 AcrR family transcriptional regulator [Microbacterium sp. SORGH_AS_0428]